MIALGLLLGMTYNINQHICKCNDALTEYGQLMWMFKKCQMNEMPALAKYATGSGSQEEEAPLIFTVGSRTEIRRCPASASVSTSASSIPVMAQIETKPLAITP